MLALALLPTLAVGLRAWAGEDEPEAEPARAEARRKVLAAIPRDSAALINVTAADMPASPDVLALGKRSTKALERCLANNPEPGLRRACADLLGILGDRTALPTLHVALEDWDASVRQHVIRALGKLPQASSFGPLVAAFQRKSETPENQAEIVTVLGALGHPRAVAFLRRELERKETAYQLRPVAFRALWRSRHLLTRAALVDIVGRGLRSDNPEWVYDAVLRAAELKAPAFTPLLLALIEHDHEDIRNKAIYALGHVGDRRAVEPLVALLANTREARVLNNIAFALERIDRASFYAQIRRLVEHQQAIIRLNATFVLGDIHTPETLPFIERSLVDPSDRVKVEALDALAKLPEQATVVRLLERALLDPSVAVQAQAITLLGQHGTVASIPALERFVAATDPLRSDSAIYAIHRLSGGKRSDLLLRLYLGKDQARRRRAAIALGEAGDARVRGYLLGCLEARQCSPEALAGIMKSDADPGAGGRILLAWAGRREELTPLVGLLHPAGASTLAQAKLELALVHSDWGAVRQAVELLVALRDEGARPRLRAALDAPDIWVRLDAKVALVRLGERAAETRLLEQLDTLPAGWLPRVASLLQRIEEPAARTRLAAELARREASADFDVALAAAAVRLAWSPEAGFPRFVRALGSSQILERELAVRYLWHRSPAVDTLLRRALAAEKDPYVRDDLQRLLEVRG